MNSTSEQLLQAVDILIDSKVQQLEFDKTIQAKIYSIVNLDTGEYKVRYNGNIFSAFASNLKDTYKIDDVVYVTVPEGDFSARKLITTSVSSKSLSYSQLASLQNSVFEISPPFENLYNGLYDPSTPRGVIAGAPETSTNSYTYIYEGPDTFNSNGYHGLFQQYANSYEYIRIQASFLTQFYTQLNGNYGIEVEFYAKEGNIVSYVLDLSNFNGDPYSFSVYSPQSVIIKVQKKYLLGLKSIKLFEKDFEYDKIIKDGVITEERNMTNPNIFVKDISLQYVEIKDLTDTAYYLTISAPKGIALTSNISSLDLIARLVYEGKDIMDDKTSCSWFVRDLSVVIGDDRYDKDVGPGWAPLDKKGPKLELNATHIRHEQRYKLKAIYNETVTLYAEIEVFNHTSIYSYHMDQLTDNADISLQLVNDNNNGTLYGDWYLSYPDGAYLAVTDGKNKNRISVSSYLKYSSVTFYCAIYDFAGSAIIGTLEHTIVNSESSEDVTISYEGEDNFRYDANGDITIEDSEKERTLQVKLTWKEGYGTAYTVEWLMYDADGKEVVLTGTPDKPASSMIEKLWVDNYNILHYNIKQKYKVNFNNNTLLVKIKTVTEEEYLFEKEILFLKDGDQGTNGTTYVIAVRPCNSNGIKLSGVQALSYNDGWLNSLNLRCYVYKDGELINSNPNYTIKYKWEGKNVTFSESDPEDMVIVNGSGIPAGDSSNLEFYVKIQVDVNDKMNGRETSIYASYPVDVAIGGLDTSLVNIDSVPSYIKYTASGTIPKFYNNNISYIYDGTPDNAFQSLNTNILDVETKDGLTYLKPASSFIGENVKNSAESTVGVIQCGSNRYQYLLHTIIMYLDTYGNEAINGWNGGYVKTEDGYILAPQIGAGEKDSYNRFTGVVMGKDTARDKIGLYGYNAGVNTFGLMQDGIAYFGSRHTGAQIVIDGTTAELYGGGLYPVSSGKGQVGGDATNGMTIRLANLMNQDQPSKVSAIKIGAGVFEVNYGGGLTATSADITGTIYAKEGYIGCTTKTSKDGWHIETNRLSSGSGSNMVALDSTDSSAFRIWAGASRGGTAYNANAEKLSDRITSPAPYVVTKDGFVYMKNAYIKGQIEATNGEIAGWTIASNKLYKGNVGMASSGNAAFWVGSDLDGQSTPNNTSDDTYFLVTRSGKLYCKSADIEGKITADSGKIGGWTINADQLRSEDGKVYLKAEGGFKAGDNFRVTKDGKLTCASANITGKLYVDELYVRQQNGTYSSALSSRLNSRNNTSISGEFIDCRGLLVGDKDRDSDYFEVDYYGNVYIGGNIEMGAGSVIYWGRNGRGGVTQTGDIPYATPDDLEDVRDSIPTEEQLKSISSTVITDTLVASPSIYGAYIYGGQIYGVDLYFGSSNNVGFGHLYGGNGYDGQHTTRVIYIQSDSGIRLEAQTNIALTASGNIYCEAPLYVEGTNIGRALEDLEDRVRDLESA